jgi:diguanylate cyclase (GGDEF)-like protein/PAS domain S-box-containing protein
VPLNLLLLEDDPDDAELIALELRRGGREVLIERVDTAEAMAAALERGGWDLVISDHSMPQLSDDVALGAVRALDPDLPFIIVSGMIGEDAAVAAIRAGANDYLMKDRLTRLVPAVERELREAAERRRVREVEEALRISEARMRAIVETSVDGILTTDAAGRVESLNSAAERMFGVARMVGKDISSLLPGVRLGATADTGREGGHSVWDAVGRRSDGTSFPVELARSETTVGERRMLTFSVRDITERKGFEVSLAHQATHDSLTGLPNRELLLDRLRVALSRSRHWSGLAVLFLDLDRFKVINDSLGHQAGDRLLVAVVERLREAMRTEDTLARLGGDEFVLVLEGVGDGHGAVTTAKRIARSMEAPFALPGGEAFVTASIGIALALEAGGDPEALLRDADAAMYRAKERGRGCYELFDELMRSQASVRLEMESALYRAIGRGELRVHYQPLVELNAGAAVGCEALVRWEYPGRGLLDPVEFIPLAEDTGLIMSVGAFVLKEACRQAVRWQNQFPGRLPLTMSVNLSGRQLADPALPDCVADALGTSGLGPDRLWLEITESVLMDDADSSARALAALKALGVRLAVDDFGTGYSSLAYLRRFPVDALKIDRSFVCDLDRGARDAVIVEAVVGLGRALGLRVVAEGVETPSQLARVRALGCDQAQGYYFARPAPPAGLCELLRSLVPLA